MVKDEALLRVRNLTVFRTGRDGVERKILDNVNLEIARGETVGLLGQSGCGKTTLAFSLLRLLPKGTRATCNSLDFLERDLWRAKERTLQQFRGAEAAIVFQEPALTLNPVMRAGEQIAEVARAHLAGHRDVWKKAADRALAAVGFADTRIGRAYPHQLSAGQRQRIAIAQAIVCQPLLIIADEPTSALDNVTQMEILKVFQDIKARLGTALLVITHNPEILFGLADRLAVIQDGRVIETGGINEIYRAPKQDHTRALLGSIFPLPAKSAGWAV